MRMTALPLGSRALVVLVGLLALAACAPAPTAGTGAGTGTGAGSGSGSGSATRSGPVGAGGSIGGWPVAAGCPGLPEPRPLTPADHPTAALQCVGSSEVVPGDGEYRIAVNQRATQGLAALVSALLLPSSPPPGGDVVCAAYASQNWVVLELGGKAVAVQTPVDECSHRLPQVDRALDGLHWTEVSRTRGEKVRGAAAVEAQCEGFKDLLTYSPATDLKPAKAQPSIGTSGNLKVCVYGVSYPPGWTADGRQGLDGVPIGGGTLTGTPANLVRAGLGKAIPAGTCTQRHTRFAVVFPVSPDAGVGVGWLSVELDGCHRILTEDNHVSVAPDDLVGALAVLAPKG